MMYLPGFATLGTVFMVTVSAIYVDKGIPYSLGKLNVSTFTVTEKQYGSPLHTQLYFPSTADQYPVIFFVGGLNGYVWVDWYDLYLNMLATHGFFVVGVDYAFPAYSKTHEEQLSQDISKFFKEIDFSTVFLEPFSIDSVDPMEHTIPAMMYGTELASEGHPGHPCSIPGIDYKQFYDIWKCPRMVVEVADFGHCDILDPLQWEACHVFNICKTTNDTRLNEYRKFVQGATASFFITELQGRPDAISYIADQSKSPLKLLLDKSDFRC